MAFWAATESEPAEQRLTYTVHTGRDEGVGRLQAVASIERIAQMGMRPGFTLMGIRSCHEAWFDTIGSAPVTIHEFALAIGGVRQLAQHVSRFTADFPAGTRFAIATTKPGRFSGIDRVLAGARAEWLMATEDPKYPLQDDALA